MIVPPLPFKVFSFFGATFIVDSSSGALEGLALMDTWTEVPLLFDRFADVDVGVGTGVDLDLLVVLAAAILCEVGLNESNAMGDGC